MTIQSQTSSSLGRPPPLRFVGATPPPLPYSPSTVQRHTVPSHSLLFKTSHPQHFGPPTPTQSHIFLLLSLFALPNSFAFHFPISLSLSLSALRAPFLKFFLLFVIHKCYHQSMATDSSNSVSKHSFNLNKLPKLSLLTSHNCFSPSF